MGAIINAVAIILGGGLGLFFKGKIPKKTADSIIRVLGLCVCVIGISGALSGDFMLIVVSLALGTFAGETLDIEGALNRLGQWAQKKISRGNETSTFAEGFVMSTLLFCVGAMAVIGSIDSGLRGDQSIIITKSIIDAVSAMIFASAFGVGVLFSALTVFAYQGSIELFAGYLQNILTDALVTQISAAGGVMLLGIGLNMILNAGLKVANTLPAFLFAAGYFYIFLK